MKKYSERLYILMDELDYVQLGDKVQAITKVLNKEEEFEEYYKNMLIENDNEKDAKLVGGLRGCKNHCIESYGDVEYREVMLEYAESDVEVMENLETYATDYCKDMELVW